MTDLSREMLAAFCRYDAHANDLVLAAAAELSNGDFEAATSPSRDSVGGLLRHMLSGELVWIARCQGRQPEIDTARLAVRGNLRAYWAEADREFLAFVDACTEADLARPVPTAVQGQPVVLPVWQMLMQSLLHSAHHRGELSIVLTQLGYPLPTLDIILQFLKESDSTQAGA